MENVWFLAAVWLGLALAATLIAIWLKVSTALSEIVVGIAAQLVIGVIVGPHALGSSSAWVAFLAGTGAIVLTFPAGAELDPSGFPTQWKESVVVGLASFSPPRRRARPASFAAMADGSPSSRRSSSFSRSSPWAGSQSGPAVRPCCRRT